MVGPLSAKVGASNTHSPAPAVAGISEGIALARAAMAALPASR